MFVRDRLLHRSRSSRRSRAPAGAQIPPLPLPTAPLPGVPPGPAPRAYQANDAGGFRSILPSGTRGRYSLPELAAYLTTGATVPHCCDQLPMYGTSCTRRRA